MQEEHLDFYQKLRSQIQGWAESNESQTYQWTQYILLAPDFFHLLVRLMADPDVPIAEKAKLAGVIAYFISPLDFLSELVLGPTGFIDDIVLTAFALNRLINQTDQYILEKHWAGDGDILHLVQVIVDTADKMIGSGVLKKLRGVLQWGKQQFFH